MPVACMPPQGPYTLDAWQLHSCLLGQADTIAYYAQRARAVHTAAGYHLPKDGWGQEATTLGTSHNNIQPKDRQQRAQRSQHTHPTVPLTVPCPCPSRSTHAKSTIGPRHGRLLTTSTWFGGSSGPGKGTEAYALWARKMWCICVQGHGGMVAWRHGM